MTQTLAVPLSVKDVAPDGVFTGYASTNGNVDHHGDRVMPGAFTKTLAESHGRLPLLSQHDPAKSIGAVDVIEDSRGLRVHGRLLLTISQARDEYERLKAGLISAMSIGYNTVRERRVGDVREILEAKLWEISLVTFPANPLARVDSVKYRDDEAALVRAIEDLTERMAFATFAERVHQTGMRLARVQNRLTHRS